LEGVERLVEPWHDVWSRSTRATAFQRPEWVVPWYRHYAPRSIALVTARRSGYLVGVAPMFFRDADGQRALSLAGEGITGYLDLVCEEGHDKAFALALLDWVRTRSGCSVVELHGLRADSALASAPPGRALLDRLGVEDVSPALGLRYANGAAATLEAFVPEAHLRALRYGRRRLERVTGAAFERADESNWRAHLDALFRLHGARWRTRGDGVVTNDATFRAFHDEVAEGMARRNALRLWSVRAGGQIVASAYGVVDGGGARFYLHGFDPARSAWSPGTVAIGFAIEDAMKEGLREFDFLRGAEHYKYDWGACDRALFRRTIRFDTRT